MSLKQLNFVGGTAITPFEEIPDSTVVLEGNRIVFVGPRGSWPASEAAETTDISGKFITPGFIDIHIHGGAGSDFMDATREDFETVCRYHAAGGTTSLLATTATAPLAEIVAALRIVREVQQDPVAGAQVLGAHIEGPYLSMAKRGCHLKEFVRNPEKAEWEQLLEFETEINHITVAPEIPGALELMRDWSLRGINISGGHTDSTYSEMMKAVDAGMAHATHMYCAMSTVARPHPPHREGGCVETVLERDEITTELIADGRHLPAELLRLTVRAKGVDRVCLVTDAMRGAGMPNGIYTFGPKHGQKTEVKDGEALMLDHSSFASSVVTMDVMVRNALNLMLLSRREAVAMATINPARFLKLADRKGSLEPGKDADCVILDEDFQVVETVIGGMRIGQGRRRRV
ncbi:MAG: N-acetylglucosamine-6-phosphate deacetylase [Acidobacteria bacterium]|nr:N-acetylglucosamine-6-phosphate deacetylase [Acidobacteriota bacterium]MCI0623372.1 N-acetylglucosamine-6-phosphate deacetylase [Acidobacteriota bacterium]MCI0721601.1 N-acetylglucosamine-6-phosphate deacetylase [Acidobacteriota bacterium]